MNKKGRRFFAGLMSLAMCISMLPANATAIDAAAVEEGIALHYDMSHEGDVLKDVSGNGKDGKMVNITDADFTDIGDAHILNFDGTDKYAEIPLGVIDDETFTIEAQFTNNTTSTAWLFTLGTTVGSWPNVKNYLFVAPKVSDGNYNGKMLAAIKNGSDELRYDKATAKAFSDTDRNLVSVTFDNGNVTYYVNGEKTSTTASGFSIQDILGANSTDSACGYVARSLYSADAKFKGTINDFKIYKDCLTDQQVADNYSAAMAVYAEEKDQLKALEVQKAVREAVLGANPSADKVTSNLVFTTEKDGVTIEWTSENADVINNSGENVYAGDSHAEAKVVAVGTMNGKEVFREEFTFVVYNPVAADVEALTIPGAEDIRGNITLPSTGANGSDIRWESSNKDVITDEAKVIDGTTVEAGIVTRQEQDTEVTLVATLSKAGVEKTKEFKVVVKAAPVIDEMTDYLFAYFPYATTKDERIYFATSEDGLNYKALNDAKFVIESKLGTHGLRDPFVIRSHEGDRFYMVATDLTVAGLTQDGVDYPGMGWADNQRIGSKCIMVWESTDLVHWTNQRMCRVATEDAGCTWAPEAYYDDATQQYVVFWASMINGVHKVFRSTTRDFVNFTEAQVWISESGSVIDTTVMKSGDYYYRYTKNESGSPNRYGTPSKRVYCERSKSLLSTEWELVDANCLKYPGGQIEGPSIMKINNDDVANIKDLASQKGLTIEGNELFCLTADATGVTIFPGVSTDLSVDGSFQLLGTKANEQVNGKPLYTMPEPAASHGTILPITREEYTNLQIAYGEVQIDLPKGVVAGTKVTLPETVKIVLSETETKDVKVTWDDVAEDAFAKPGVVTLRGVLEGYNRVVTPSIKVTAAEEVNRYIYYIDTNSTENDVFDSLLTKNETLHQIYKDGESWGYVMPEQGVYEKADGGMYGNGYAAKGGDNCEYILTLDKGTYKITGYYHEWWSVTRPMAVYATYTDGDKTVTTGKAKVTISGDNVDDEASVIITVENDNTKVHFVTEKDGSSDPVISGVTVEKASGDDILNGAVENLTIPSVSSTTTKIDLPAEAEGGVQISWKSSHPEVIAEDGTVTRGIEDVTVTLTATLTYGEKSAEKQFTVKVTKDIQKLLEHDLNAIVVPNKTSKDITLPTTGENGVKITWLSDNESVLSTTGEVVVGNSPVTVHLTAIATYGTKRAEKEFTVVVAKDEIVVKKVSLNKTSVTIAQKEIYTLKASVSPSNAANKKITWKSSNTKVAKVDSKGKITAVSAGTATITAQSANSAKATCKVVVKKAPSKVTLSKKSTTVAVKKTVKVKISLPKNTMCTKYTVKTSNKKYATATVSGNYLVIKGVKKGSATITVTANNSKKSAKISVKVK